MVSGMSVISMLFRLPQCLSILWLDSRDTILLLNQETLFLKRSFSICKFLIRTYLKLRNSVDKLSKQDNSFDSKRAISDVTSLEDWSVETFDVGVFDFQ